jgi:hypothetical protein
MVFVCSGQQKGSLFTKNGVRPRLLDPTGAHISPPVCQNQGSPHRFSPSNDDAGIIVLRSG